MQRRVAHAKWNLVISVQKLTAEGNPLGDPLAVVADPAGWSEQLEASLARVGRDGAIWQGFVRELDRAVGWGARKFATSTTGGRYLWGCRGLFWKRKERKLLVRSRQGYLTSVKIGDAEMLSNTRQRKLP